MLLFEYNFVIKRDTEANFSQHLNCWLHPFPLLMTLSFMAKSFLSSNNEKNLIRLFSAERGK